MPHTLTIWLDSNARMIQGEEALAKILDCCDRSTNERVVLGLDAKEPKRRYKTKGLALSLNGKTWSLDKKIVERLKLAAQAVLAGRDAEVQIGLRAISSRATTFNTIGQA